MIRTILKRSFSTAADVLSTKNLRMFGSGDYPQAMDHSRPFCTNHLISVLSKTSNGITVATEQIPSRIARYLS